MNPLAGILLAVSLAATPDPDFFNSVQSYDAHVQFMTELTATYPTLAQMISIGTSVEGRTIWALRITGVCSGINDKPAVVFNAAQRADLGFSGASMVTFIAYHLVARYDSDPQVAALVDNVEWYLIPIVNPDAYVNRSGLNAYGLLNANGVYLNRNWGGPGSGESPIGGPYPFSEPETAAMRDFFVAHPNLRAHVDIFSGYEGFYEFRWPWAHTWDPSPDELTYEAVGTHLCDLVEASGGYCRATGFPYRASGLSVDYTYGELGLWAYTFVFPGYLPDHLATALASMLYLGEWVKDCNDNMVADADDICAGTSMDCNANNTPDECEVLEDPGSGAFPDGCWRDCNSNGVYDLCDVNADTSEDCNTNHIPDECEPDEDCNGNGVQDICDVAVGPSQDCNENAVPDECEMDCNANSITDECDITDGFSLDCDANGAPDECDLVTDPDCNGNNRLDECDVAGFVAASGQLSPIGSWSSQRFTIPAPPLAIDDVSLSFSTFADLSAEVSEQILVDINGTPVGAVFATGANDCPALPDVDEIIVPATLFNSLAAAGAAINMIPSTLVDPILCSPSTFIEVSVTYETAMDCNASGVPDECELVENDCNGNDLPDDCETDLDGDGFIDPCDNCVASDTSVTIVIESCDSRVGNRMLGGGCTMADTLGACPAQEESAQDYARCVARHAVKWKRQGLISDTDVKRLKLCAGNLPVRPGPQRR